MGIARSAENLHEVKIKCLTGESNISALKAIHSAIFGKRVEEHLGPVKARTRATLASGAGGLAL